MPEPTNEKRLLELLESLAPDQAQGLLTTWLSRPTSQLQSWVDRTIARAIKTHDEKQSVARFTPERIEALMADSETFKVFEPYISKAADEAIKAHDAKLQPMIEKLKDSVPERLAERVEKLAKASDERVRQVELRYHLRDRCRDAGVDPSLFEGLRLGDEKEIDRRVLLAAKTIERNQTADINQRLIGDSHRPGSGGVSGL